MTHATPSPTIAAIPPPIPGGVLDPPPQQLADTLAKVDGRSSAAGAGYRAFLRFSDAKASLLAAGTTYYLFLSVFAMLVFAFGLAALIGGEELADTVTRRVSNAFPGLIGDQGFSTQTLAQVAQTTSVLGLIVLLYSSSGAMVALSSSMHLIYGAPKDPRNFVVARARLLAWMLLLAPLIGLSFVPSVVISNFVGPVERALGLDSRAWTWLLLILTGVLSIGINALVVWLILGHMGGIRPARNARLTGTAVGAVGIEILKYLLSFIIGWSVSKPQYGAFAAPIAMLLVLYLESLVLYGAASLTAGTAVAAGNPDDVPRVEPIPA
ncbi:MAG: YihY/virulence factor BrkB family protein [Candidatus Nanopelagicales bacterium]